ncbi:MAG: AAA family ATPase [Bacteroidaceae bacterium]|nr:AAA family ATPase [Bacteroidaceae bacterium]
MSKIRVIGPIIKGVSRQGIPGMVAAVIKHLKSVDQLSELLDQCQITPGKLISLASCSFAIDSNKETRDSNVDISTEFVYNGNRYYLYKEIEGGQFDRFISKFNEIFSSDYIIEKNSITHNGKERDCFYMYDLHSNPNEDESEKDDNETIDNNQKNNKAKLSNSKIKEQLPFDTKVVIDTISATGLIFDPKFVQRYLCSLLTKPFVILSGLTGSGKTQLAMAFPKLICEDKSQYKLIPVGADWTNREQLLGYPNALRPGEYVLPDNGALQLIIEASKPENQNKPYFLVLDEMNMSYVERYFADFLSAMESGEEIPLWTGSEKSKVPATITLPKNLFIIGT